MQCIDLCERFALPPVQASRALVERARDKEATMAGQTAGHVIERRAVGQQLQSDLIHPRCSGDAVRLD